MDQLLALPAMQKWFQYDKITGLDVLTIKNSALSNLSATEMRPYSGSQEERAKQNNTQWQQRRKKTI